MAIEIEFYRVQVWDGRRAKWIRSKGRRYDLEAAKRVSANLLEEGFESRILRVIETIEELKSMSQQEAFAKQAFLGFAQAYKYDIQFDSDEHAFLNTRTQRAWVAFWNGWEARNERFILGGEQIDCCKMRCQDCNECPQACTCRKAVELGNLGSEWESRHPDQRHDGAV